MKYRWFCRDCWRSGESEVFGGDPLEAATFEHYQDVSRSMQAGKIPAGMDENLRNHPIMQKYPGVDCKGDVLLGERKGRPRIPKPENQTFPEFGDMKND